MGLVAIESARHDPLFEAGPEPVLGFRRAIVEHAAVAGDEGRAVVALLGADVGEFVGAEAANAISHGWNWGQGSGFRIRGEEQVDYLFRLRVDNLLACA